nr:unnamed protein product [Callosobruchus chinensis]
MLILDIPEITNDILIKADGTLSGSNLGDESAPSSYSAMAISNTLERQSKIFSYSEVDEEDTILTGDENKENQYNIYTNTPENDPDYILENDPDYVTESNEVPVNDFGAIDMIQAELAEKNQDEDCLIGRTRQKDSS